MDVGGQRHAPAALPLGKRPGTNCTVGLWAPGPVCTGAVDVSPTGIRSPDRPARIESLGRLSYPGPLMFGVANVHFSSRIVVEMRFIYFFQNLKCYTEVLMNTSIGGDMVPYKLA
jgi:hypothetical protein